MRSRDILSIMLFLGTQNENISDRWRKERSKRTLITIKYRDPGKFYRMDYIERNHRALLEFMVKTQDRFHNFAFPVKPNHSFDVIAIEFNKCIRVRIICTETQQNSGAYVANLLKSGGYQNRKEKKVHFDKISCDYIYVWTPEYKYLIPVIQVEQTRALTMSMYEEYII